jgi:hypothetical protein
MRWTHCPEYLPQGRLHHVRPKQSRCYLQLKSAVDVKSLDIVSNLVVESLLRKSHVPHSL